MKKKIVVVVNGFPESGKDSFVDFCIDNLTTYAEKCSTVATPKHIAKNLGWDGTKNSVSRVMLSELKDWHTKHFNGPFIEIVERIINGERSIIFAMIREPEEIKKVQDFCWMIPKKVKCITLLVRDDNATPNEELSHSDRNVMDIEYDVAIPNETTFKDLKDRANEFSNDLIVDLKSF